MILYTSVTNNNKVYLVTSIITFIFAQVYNLFSHNVYSIFMTYAFMIPLVFGFIPSILNIYKKININNKLYKASIFTFLAYSLSRGFLEIYGTTNSLINIYLYVGSILLILSFIKGLFKTN